MKPAAPANPKTFLERDNWMRAINTSGAPHGARCLAFAIALHLHVTTGRCDPAHKTLSKDAGMSERSIRRWVALLVRAGWLATRRGGRRYTNDYVLLRPAKALAALESLDRPVSASWTGQFEYLDRPPVGRSEKREKRREKKKGSKTLPPVLASPDSEPVSAAQAAPKRKRPAEQGSKQVPAEAFAEFWAAYPRRVAKEAAQKAFAAAIKRGAAPPVLIAGAKRHAVERAGQDPKYTKHPTTWLNGGCWQDEPAGANAGVVIDEQGNVVAMMPRPTPGGVWERAAARVLAEYEGRKQ